MKSKILLALGTIMLFSIFVLINKAIARQCNAGGIGANTCRTEAGANFPGLGASKGCMVGCDPGYYACCNFYCECKKYPSGPDTGGGNEGGGPDGGGGDSGHGA